MKKTSVGKTSKDSKSRIPIAEVTIEKLPFILVNLYNANRRTIKTLCELGLLFDDFLWDDSKNKYFAEDLNLFFDSNVKAFGGSPTLKKKSTSKILQLTGKYDLVDIWRTRNPASNSLP